MNLTHNLKQLFRRPPLTEQAPALGVTGMLGRLALYAAPPDPPPGGDGVYRRMTHDPQVKACLNTKRYAVLSRGWEVHPASPSGEDRRVADFCRWCLEHMDGSILDAGYDVLDALAFGTSLLEINYRLLADGPWRGLVGLQSLKAKDARQFTIRTDEFLNVQTLRLAGGVELDPAKFLRYTYMPRYGSPHGESDLRAAHRAWAMKEALLTWWGKSLEKFGLPTVVGTFDGKAGFTRAHQQEFLDLVRQVHNEAALVLPDDLKIALLDGRAGQGSGSAGSGFDELIAYLDRSIAKSILGQTLTSDSESKGATYALGAVHMDVLKFYINKLTRDLEESVLTRQLLSRLVGYNFPPGTPTPALTLGRLDDDRLAVLGTLIGSLIQGNVIAPGEPWIREYLGLPAREAQTA